jgi:hypothetical protein
MTAAGKKCAEKSIVSNSWGLKCYLDLGYTPGCAQIWQYDSAKTTSACTAVCFKNLNSPNNGPAPECKINDCLQCDEDKAGPLFKAFAGRTRRRSGLMSAIIRGCDDIAQITQSVCNLGATII